MCDGAPQLASGPVSDSIKAGVAMIQQRSINRNIRSVVLRYLQGCMPGTRINAAVLARQLSDRDRVFLVGTVAEILRKQKDLRFDSINDYLVI